MTKSDNNAVDDKSRIRKDKSTDDGKQESDDKAPGQSSESGYPNDDYWDKGVRDKSKEPPTDSTEPDTGYRWES